MFPRGALVKISASLYLLRQAPVSGGGKGRGLELGVIFLSLDRQLYRNANNVVTEALLSYQTVRKFHPILMIPISVRGTLCKLV